jgi:hypothetical protein
MNDQILIPSRDNGLFLPTAARTEPGKLSRYSDGLDSRGIGFRFLAGVRDFSLVHSIQTGAEAHSASYPMGLFP